MTRARTPPLMTRERNRQKLEALQADRDRSPAGQSSSNLQRGGFWHAPHAPAGPPQPANSGQLTDFYFQMPQKSQLPQRQAQEAAKPQQQMQELPAARGAWYQEPVAFAPEAHSVPPHQEPQEFQTVLSPETESPSTVPQALSEGSALSISSQGCSSPRVFPRPAPDSWAKAVLAEHDFNSPSRRRSDRFRPDGEENIPLTENVAQAERSLTLDSPVRSSLSRASEISTDGLQSACSSKVAQMCSLWERRSMSSAVAKPSGQKVRASGRQTVCQRNTLHFLRRQKEERQKTIVLNACCVAKLKSFMGDATWDVGFSSPGSDVGSPLGSTTRNSHDEAESPGTEVSKTCRLHERMLGLMRSRLRMVDEFSASGGQAVSNAASDLVPCESSRSRSLGARGSFVKEGFVFRPQPEEEAEDSMQKNFEEEAVNNSRLSLPEPETEKQPLQECRFAFGFDDEPPEADANTAEPSCLSDPTSQPDGEAEAEDAEEAEEAEDAQEAEEVDEASEESDLESGSLHAVEAADDSFELVDRPKAGEEGMPRGETFLYLFEQSELQRMVSITVPPGMGPDRTVTFMLENKKHDVRIPEGYHIGQQVLVQVPKRPPLERNPSVAWCRGHANFPDRANILEPLKHNSRADRNCQLDDPEFVHRRYLYSLLRGSSMSPLLSVVDEVDEER